MATQRATKSPGEGWIDVESAAAFLGLSAVALRRTIERAAKKHDDGAIIAHIDGITARKLGRLWRVRLDAKWLRPTPIKE